MTHPSAADLTLYVTDALAAPRAAAIEAHVAGCAGCGSALAAEARLEGDLEQVARSSTCAEAAVRGPPRGRRTAALVAAAAAAAAVVLVVGGQGSGDPAASRGSREALSPPGADAGLVVARDDGGERDR